MQLQRSQIEWNMFDVILTGPFYGRYDTNYDIKIQTTWSFVLTTNLIVPQEVCRFGLLNFILIIKDWKSQEVFPSFRNWYCCICW